MKCTLHWFIHMKGMNPHPTNEGSMFYPLAKIVRTHTGTISRLQAQLSWYQLCDSSNKKAGILNVIINHYLLYRWLALSSWIFVAALVVAGSLVSLIGIGAAAFVATNIDDIVVLMVFFSSATFMLATLWLDSIWGLAHLSQSAHWAHFSPWWFHHTLLD